MRKHCPQGMGARRLTLRTLSALFALVILLVLPSSSMAQGIVTGSISGTVQDPKGAVVPGAKVTATQVGTNRAFTTQTSPSGVVSLRSLPNGVYNVTIEAPNFQSFAANGVAVSVGKDTPLGLVQLQVGSNKETVTVEGAAPLVETTSNQISDTFDTKKVADLPIGNTFDSLALFVPGVATAGDASFSNNNGAEFSVNGQRARSNNFQLDGQNNNDSTIGGPSIFFGNQDVISEVQVVTNYSAEYGRNLGSTVNYVTKSGTNQFHGTAYEFNQNSAFDSLDNEEKSRLQTAPGQFVFTGPDGNPFCAKGQKSTDSDPCDNPGPPKYIDNRFGGTIGGPIKKNKIWFFASSNFERTRTAGSPSSSSPSLLPTPQGIQQLQAAFPNNPAVAALTTFGPTAVKAGNPTFTPSVSPVLVSATPGVDCTATPGACVPIQFGTVTRFLPSVFNDYEATGRVDFQLSQKDRLFTRYIFQQNIFTNEQFNGAAAGAGGDFVDVPGRSQQIGLDYTHTFRDNLLNQVRFSYARSRSGFEGGAYPNCLQTNLNGCTPQITFSDPNVLGFGENLVFPQGRIINVYQLQNNASWLHNKHMIKFGGEYDRQRAPNFGLFNINGVYDFATFNDFLANSPDAVSIADGPFEFPFKENDFALYFQDDWRVKENLTLNLGLRWEYYGQAVNLLHDRSVAQQTGPNPLWDKSLPLSLTTVPSYPNHWKNFGPVFGFAWTPNMLKKVLGENQTVIRGGFRIAYDFPYYNLGLNVGGSAPLVNLVNFPADALPGLPSAGSLSPDVRAALLPLAPTGGNPGFDAQTVLNPDFRSPYSEQWTLGVQRSVGNKVAAEVRYVGNHTLHNFQETNGNPFITPLIDAGFSNLIPKGITPCADPNAPGFGRVDCNRSDVTEYSSTAYSIYHGLQSQLRIGDFHGLTLSASYTFSKTIDNASEAFSSSGYGGSAVAYAQNPFDITRGERATSGYSFPHVVGLLLIYDFPFYKGQNGFLGHVLGGWQMNTTYRYTSGQAYTTVQTWRRGSLCDPTNFTGVSTRDACRPILANPAAPLTAVGLCTDPTASDCGINLYDPSIAGPAGPTQLSAVHWIFNNANAAQFFGSPFLGAPRNLDRGQPISTANLAFFKNTKLSERLTLQFQAEAFNVLNTQFLGVPSGRINSAAFGNVGFNVNGGSTFAGNLVTDGIGRRRLLFGLKMMF